MFFWLMKNPLLYWSGRPESGWEGREGFLRARIACFSLHPRSCRCLSRLWKRWKASFTAAEKPHSPRGQMANPA